MKESSLKTFFDDEIVLLPESGTGIQFGEYGRVPPTFGWRDITAPIEVRGVAATDPDWTRVGSTAFYAYKFVVGDYVWQQFHIPHDIVPGSQIHFHVHWFPGTLSSPVVNNYVTWQFAYAYAKGFNQANYDFAMTESPLTNAGIVYATDRCPTTLYRSMVTETAAVTLPGLTEPDGLIHVRVGRVNNLTSPIANSTESIFVSTTDVHYQSTNLSTVGKAPGFYG